MRKIVAFVAVVLCVFGLCIPVFARSSAEQLCCEAMVGEDGSCAVTLSVSVTFDEAVAEPKFPIPAEATDVTLNGSAVGVSLGSRGGTVDLRGVTGGMAGTHSFVITYRLVGAVVAQQDGSMLLTLPILCGFDYPVDDLAVTVTLPGAVTGEPTFVSGYYQENTADLLAVSVSGSAIAIRSRQTLLDHETLTMTLPADASLFPSTAATARVLGLMDIAILVSIVLAAIYYLLAMRPALPKKILRSTGPDSITAGQVSVWLTGGGTDLSLLVVAWAQLGYLRIQVEDTGRVLLHKRMEMGNERSLYENRVYKNLFGRRLVVDGTGDHYARLVRTVAKRGPQAGEVYRTNTGNPYIFRGLCALPALLSGIGMAGALAPHSLFLQILMAVIAAVMAVLIQSGAASLVLRNKLPLWIAVGCAVVWLVLGIVAGQWITAVLMIAFQVLAGLAAAYGGKRTELGQQALVQLLGLRKFLCSASKTELQRLLKANPGYFYEVAPYALALGVDHAFARRFGKLRIPDCTYLITPHRSQMTAAEWAAALRAAVDALDAKARRRHVDKLTGR
ncbi:MAG: DUF2207 domain-containing protein [Oscillospiraceae bacterium]|nr:DUF2207 domain-containing protein [Oscillospiraceae bacterium]